jgi:hypothetical protein
MNRALFASLLVAGTAAPAFAQTDLALDGDKLFARAKRFFRAQRRPPFTVYSIERKSKLDGFSDGLNSYTLRIWYRASDGAALSRRIDTDPMGNLQYIEPKFNGAIDPGPPEADIFALPAFVGPTAAPAVAASGTPLPVIGSVTASGEYDYKVVRVVPETMGKDDVYHLYLEPRRDPDRNRLREIWIDRDTALLRRALANDRLYVGTEIIFDLFDIRYGPVGSRWGIAQIDGASNALDDGSHDTVHYRFYDVTYPETLPDWYFQPAHYREHIRNAPS